MFGTTRAELLLEDKNRELRTRYLTDIKELKAKLKESTEKAELHERQSASYKEDYLDSCRNARELESELTNARANWQHFEKENEVLKAQLEHSVPNGKIRLHGHRDPITVNELIGLHKQYRELSTDLARKNAELEEQIYNKSKLLDKEEEENKRLIERVERQVSCYNQLEKQTNEEIEALNVQIAQMVTKDKVRLAGCPHPVSVTTLIEAYEANLVIQSKTLTMKYKLEKEVAELTSANNSLENFLKDVKEDRARSSYVLNERLNRQKQLLEEKDKENTALKQFNEAVCNQNKSMCQYIKETTDTHWFSVINFFK